MAQIFHHSTNTIARVSIYGAVIVVGLLGFALNVVNQTSYVTEVHNARPAARAVQPQASRRRTRSRLPLLPFLGRGFLLRGHAPDADLHDLPFADLDQRRNARAGSRQLPRFQAHFLDARQRRSRFRLFQSQHSRGQGRRLHHLPRSRRGNEHHLARRDPLHALVPGLPHRSGEISAAALRSL